MAEIAPAILIDYVFLSADAPFHLEYVYRTAMLESNSGLKGLILSDNAVHLKDDLVVIGHDGLDGDIPDYCTYLYNSITLQVRVLFDEEDSTNEAKK